MQATLCTTFKTPRNAYVYDAWSNQILRVDENVYQVLRESLREIPSEEQDDPMDQDARAKALAEIGQARESGLLLNPTCRVVCFTDQAIQAAPDELSRLGPDHLTLNVTEQCNFRCRYCLYSGAYEDQRTHSAVRMSPEVLDATLDWYHAHPDREEFSLSFYGGEPLLEMDLLRRAAERVRRSGRKTSLRMTTNASLMDEDKARFLIENGFHVLVSLDGPPNLHDRYRRTVDGHPTFERTWAGVNLLRRLDPDYYQSHVRFNMVLPPPVDLRAIHAFVLEHPEVFAKSHIRATLLNDSPCELPRELGYDSCREQLNAQFDWLQERFEQAMLSGQDSMDPFLLGVALIDYVPLHLRPLAPLAPVTPSLGQCVPGRAKAFAGTSGDLRVCERLPGVRPLGNVFTGVDATAVTSMMHECNHFLADRCAGCWAIRLCSKCLANLNRGEALDEELFAAHCRRAKIFWRAKLARYSSILEQKPDAFSWVDREMETRG